MTFVIIHDGAVDRSVSYEGMSEQAVLDMLNIQGFSFEIVGEKKFKEFNDAKPNQDIKVDPIKEQAKTDLNTKTKSDKERLEAIITYLGLDK